jgi:hypothetical protein
LSSSTLMKTFGNIDSVPFGANLILSVFFKGKIVSLLLVIV